MKRPSYIYIQKIKWATRLILLSICDWTEWVTGSLPRVILIDIYIPIGTFEYENTIDTGLYFDCIIYVECLYYIMITEIDLCTLSVENGEHSWLMFMRRSNFERKTGLVIIISPIFVVLKYCHKYDDDISEKFCQRWHFYRRRKTLSILWFLARLTVFDIKLLKCFDI